MTLEESLAYVQFVQDCGLSGVDLCVALGSAPAQVRRLQLSQVRVELLNRINRPGYWWALSEGFVDAEVMFIGEAPGEMEARLHRPFVGPAGRALQAIITQLGLTRSDCAFVNAVPCIPRRTKPTDPRDAAPFLDSILSEVALTRPHLCVILGAFASEAIVQVRTERFSEIAGTFTLDVVPGVPTLLAYHPAAGLRRAELGRRLAVQLSDAYARVSAPVNLEGVR